MEQKTPLYQKHMEAKGKMVPFSGYLLPVQYPTGTIAEHMAVRTKAGLFDVSHMGEFFLSGKDALSNLEVLCTNQISGMHDGQTRYSLMCNEQGGVIDDLLVYRFHETSYLLVVNAANRQKDADWIRTRLTGEVLFDDASDRIAQVALQGPKAKEILEKVAAKSDIPQRYYHFIGQGLVAQISCLIAQTGYTGELGYEIYCGKEDAPRLWDALLTAGAEEGLIPCGLGARDTLRLEAAMPLYGHEMDETISPLEAGLGFAVKLAKEADFIGKKALLNMGAPKRCRIGLAMTGRGIAREQSEVYAGEKKIGTVTSGTHCPYLKKAVAMALVDPAYEAVGTKVEIDVRGRKVEAEVVPLPFYRR